MKYTKLGKSDLTVSRICMGCMGVMAQSKPANAKEKHVWSTGNQNI